MKKMIGAILLVMMLVLTGCGGTASSPADGTMSKNSLPDQKEPTPAESTTSPNKESEIKTFSVEPVDGWIFLDAASSDTFKSYNLLEPYVGSANFWVKYVGDDVFSGEEQTARAAVELMGISDYEFVSVDQLEYGMPAVRCITDYTLNGMKFTLGHYFIDVPGEKDIYFQLSTAPENFQEAQPLWEEALKTVKAE